MNGMGETSVAVFSDDPLAMITNPAHLGMQSLRSNFSLGGNYSELLPHLAPSDFWYTAFAFNKCFNLGLFSTDVNRISLGVGYARTDILEGWSVFTSDPYGLTIPVTYSASCDQINLGLGFRGLLEVSAGFSVKHVYHHISTSDRPDASESGVGRATAYDYGLLASIPVTKLVSQITGKQIAILTHLLPSLELNIGYAKNNLGGDRIYTGDVTNKDPLPRYARIGFGLQLGITYTNNGTNFRPLSFQWTTEANDVLIRYIPTLIETTYDSTSGLYHERILADARWENQSGIGDIDFMNDVFFGKSNSKIIKKKGWEFNLMEVLAIRGGGVEGLDRIKGLQYSTFGYGVNVSRLAQWIGFVDTVNVAVVFNQSRYSTDDSRIQHSGTTFYSLGFTVNN
jgi:hypothetical protein